MRTNRQRLERAFEQALKQEATLDDPIRFTTTCPIRCGGRRPLFHHNSTIPEGSLVRVHHTAYYTCIIWTTLEGVNHIAFEDLRSNFDP
jgi:hypothetical protein